MKTPPIRIGWRKEKRIISKRPEQEDEDTDEFEKENVCEVLTLMMSDELIIDVNQSFSIP